MVPKDTPPPITLLLFLEVSFDGPLGEPLFVEVKLVFWYEHCNENKCYERLSWDFIRREASVLVKLNNCKDS